MNLDRLLHASKTFGELTDADVETCLRERQFQREHLNLEFKVAFPIRSGGKFEIRDVCKYIAGFSNEDGGIVIYGVADSIKDPKAVFPAYITGLSTHPSIEDLSEWVTGRITPLVQSPAIRPFTVDGKTLIVLKIPEGINRPYAYIEPNSSALTFFKKTAGGIRELRPDEVKDLYWSAILDQSSRILRAGALQGFKIESPTEDLFTKHRERAIPLLEDPVNYGRVSIYCRPLQIVEISVADLKRFMEQHRSDFAESLRYAPKIDVFQSGVSAGYFPRAIRQDIKSTSRVTLYSNGLVALDMQADESMDRENNLHPYWLSYEVQRQLQLAKAVLSPYGVETIRVKVELDNISAFHMMVSDGWGFKERNEYTGSHDPIEVDVKLSDIHDFNGNDRNTAFPAVRRIMDEVSRIFGLPQAHDGLWTQDGKLVYVRGLEGSR